jgi:hypothetical protein
MEAWGSTCSRDKPLGRAQGEVGAHHERVVVGCVVARTAANLNKAQVVVGSPGRLVLLVYLERSGLCVENMCVVAQARHQA